MPFAAASSAKASESNSRLPDPDVTNRPYTVSGMNRIVTARRMASETFEVGTRSGHRITVRAGASSAADPGPAPMELMLASLATCSAATIESIIGKMRLQIDDLVVAVDAIRADSVPRVWTDVMLRYHVRGAVPAERVERAAEIAGRTCSASVMLERVTRLEHLAYLVAPVPEGDTRDVRHAVLRAGMPVESVDIPGQESAAWFGVLHGGGVLGTAGLFEEPSPEGTSDWRLRGMATAEPIRGTGLGAMLIAAVLDHARSLGASSVWCSARAPAAGFYLHHGFEATSDEYEVDGIGPHLRMRIDL